MAKKTRTTWDYIKSKYAVFGIPSKIIDYIAVLKILKACADGYKNSTIEGLTKQGRGYINDVIVEFFYFYGWDETLDISPLLWYNKCNGNKAYFEKNCREESFMMTEKMIREAYRICTNYTKILAEIKEHYADNRTA